VDTRHSSLKWEWPEEYWRWELPGGILEVGVAWEGYWRWSLDFVSLDLPLHLLVILHSLLQLVTGEEFWVVALVNVPGENTVAVDIQYCPVVSFNCHMLTLRAQTSPPTAKYRKDSGQ